MSDFVLFIILLIIAFVIFLVCRELNCWYLKINERNHLLEQMIENQKKIIELLEDQNN